MDPLTAGPNYSEGPGGHTVDWVVCYSVWITDSYAEPAEVCPDDVEVEAGGAGDVQDTLLTGVRSFIRIQIV